jgi:hypothetical protein
MRLPNKFRQLLDKTGEMTLLCGRSDRKRDKQQKKSDTVALPPVARN